ncbi:MAG: hypothetical protein ACTS3F_12165 [Phycisphaerales bacterium]
MMAAAGPPAPPSPPATNHHATTPDTERNIEPKPHALPPPRPANALEHDNTHAAPLSPEDLWDRVVAQASKSNYWAGMIARIRLRSIRAGIATIELASESLRSTLNQPRNRAELAEFLSSAAGRPITPEITIAPADADDSDQGDHSDSEHPARHQPARHPATIDPALRARAEQDPLVRKAMELFNARITDIRPPDSD